ncbi:IBR domain-containing protein [Candidatus Dependentiae bacterium]|nr:IBR domain-containing protein [Candidatus Dependentiae bacterium]
MIRNIIRSLICMVLLAVMPVAVTAMNNQPAAEEPLCQICFANDVNTQEGAFIRLSCGHDSYCRVCLNRVIDNAIGDNRAAALCCPFEDCRRPFTQDEIRTIVANNGQRLGVIAGIQVAANPQYRHCPMPNCTQHFVYNGVPVLMNCPECRSRYCANCLLLHDATMSCAVARERQARAQANVDPNIMQFCPRCHVLMERIAGCNHMTCRCGHEFCWLCGIPWPGYNGHACPTYGGLVTEARARANGRGVMAGRNEELARMGGVGVQLREVDVREAGHRRAEKLVCAIFIGSIVYTGCKYLWNKLRKSQQAEEEDVNAFFADLSAQQQEDNQQQEKALFSSDKNSTVTAEQAPDDWWKNAS